MTDADLAALRARVGSLARSVEAARRKRDKLRQEREQVADYAKTLRGLAADARLAGKNPSDDFKSWHSEGGFTRLLRSNAARHQAAVVAAAAAVDTAAGAVKTDAKRLEREADAAGNELARYEYELAMARRALSAAGG